MLRKTEKGRAEVREHAQHFHLPRANKRYSEPHIVGFVADFPL